MLRLPSINLSVVSLELEKCLSLFSDFPQFISLSYFQGFVRLLYQIQKLRFVFLKNVSIKNVFIS